MLAIDRTHLNTVLAVAIKAIFFIMDTPEVAVRQCPLAMDKWLELVIGPRQIMLGLIINTNKLTTAISHKYHINISKKYLAYLTLPSICTNIVSRYQKPKNSLES
jgi:hypothetical protein